MTTETIQINIREDGSRVVVVNITNIANAANNAAGAVDHLQSAFKRLATVLIVREFIQAADAMVLLEARLKLATRSTEEFVNAQQELYNISQRNNTGLKETTMLYTRLADPIRRLGGGAKEVTAIVDAFATSLRISGATTREAASATLQFSQAMGSGKLAGDEFRSLAENAPRFMRALADGLGVPTGALKGMSSQGELTADVIGNALVKSLQSLKKEAAGLSNTVGGAMSDLSNDTLITVAAFDKLYGVTYTVSESIGGISLLVFELGKMFKEELAEGSKDASTQLDAMTTTIQIVGTVFETLLVLGSEVSHTFKMIGAGIGGFVAQMEALARGDMGAVNAIQEQLIERGNQAAMDLERYQKRVLTLTDRTLESRKKLQTGEAASVEELTTLKATVNEKDMLETRMRLAGITKNYFEDLRNLQRAFEAGSISQKEYIGLMSELATKTYAASAAGKEAAKGLRGSDDRLKTMKDMLIQEEIIFNREEAIFDERLKMLDLYHSKFDTSQSEFFAGREAARAEFIASEQKSYEKERSIIESFKPKNAKELADNKTRLSGLLKQHEDFVNKMVSARTNDELSQLANAKAIASTSQDAINNYLSSQYDALQALKQTTDAREVSRSSIERENVAIYEQAIANLKLNASMPVGDGRTQEDIDAANRFIDFLTAELNLRKGITAELEKQESMKFAKRMADQAIKDWERVGNTISDSLSDAFGTAGKAAGQMFKAFATGQAERLRSERKIVEAKKLSDEDPQKIKAIQEAQLEGTQAQLKQYADMTTAAKGFFEEGSRGYRAMDAAAKVLHASEVALSLIKGVNAILTQGSGDPYSAFARMAAMGALVAGLGVAISGGGNMGAGMSQSRQETAGTGTVFGATDAKSESIANALSKLEDNSSIDLVYTNEMLKTLRMIEGGINGLANVVIRSSGILSGKPGTAGVAEGTSFTDYTSRTGGLALLAGQVPKLMSKMPIIGGMITKLFGTTISVVDQGIADFSSSIKTIMETGLNLQSFVEVQTTKKFLGFKTSQAISTQLGGLPQEVSEQFELVIKNIFLGVTQAANQLGMGGDAFTEKLMSFVVEIDKISTKGLSGDEIQKQFEAIFSKFGDELAQFGVAGLEQFQKVGEGYFETLVRIANNFTNVQSILNAVGLTMDNVGLSSIVARENLIELFNGIENLAEGTAYFVENFFSAEEKISSVMDHLNQSFEKLGISIPKTVEEYKNLTLAQDLNTQAGRDMYAALIQLGPEFIQYQEHLKNVSDVVAEAAAVAKQAAIDLADALLNNVQAAFASLQKAINAEKTRLTQNYQAALADLEKRGSIVEANINVLKSASDAIHSAVNSMRLTESALYHRLGAQATIQQAIKTGKVPVQATLQTTLSTLAQNSEDLFTNSADYRRDFYRTANDLTDLATITDNQLTIEQDTLNGINAQKEVLKLGFDTAIAALDKELELAQSQVDLLTGINDKQTSIVDALFTLGETIKAAMANSLAGSSASIAGAYSQYLGRQAEPGAIDYWKGQAAAGVDVVGAIAGSQEAKINNLYRSLLGRESDVGGMTYWMEKLKSGTSLETIGQGIMGSQEFKKIKPPGFANGGMFGGGLRMVGENAPELEVTGPSRIYNPDQMSDMMGSSAIVDILIRVEKALEVLNDFSEQTRDNTKDSFDTLNRVTAGGNVMLTQPIEA